LLDAEWLDGHRVVAAGVGHVAGAGAVLEYHHAISAEAADDGMGGGGTEGSGGHSRHVLERGGESGLEPAVEVQSGHHRGGVDDVGGGARADGPRGDECVEARDHGRHLDTDSRDAVTAHGNRTSHRRVADPGDAQREGSRGEIGNREAAVVMRNVAASKLHELNVCGHDWLT
jgi:hypothetical protein